MSGPPDPEITFVRLISVDLASLTRLLNEPRNRRHMPLAGDMTEADVEEWVRAKDAQWDAHGYGPWGILLDGRFAGWGGFQQEETDADYALVLFPWAWGAGADVTRAALEIGFTELGFSSVTILLPITRRPDAAMRRLGFVTDGHADIDGSRFARFRLTRDRAHGAVWDPPPHPVL